MTHLAINWSAVPRGKPAPDVSDVVSVDGYTINDAGESCAWVTAVLVGSVACPKSRVTMLVPMTALILTEEAER